MEKEKKAKAPSKKELMREIENLDTNKVLIWCPFHELT